MRRWWANGGIAAPTGHEMTPRRGAVVQNRDRGPILLPRRLEILRRSLTTFCSWARQSTASQSRRSSGGSPSRCPTCPSVRKGLIGNTPPTGRAHCPPRPKAPRCAGSVSRCTAGRKPSTVPGRYSSGEENILNLDAGRKLLAVHDREEALDSAIAFTTGVHERNAHLASAVIAGASSDPELDRYLTGLLASINLQIRRILEVYRDREWVRSDVPFEELVETAAVLHSVDTYLRITHRDGWSVAAYRTWLRRMLAETVFRPPQAN